MTADIADNAQDRIDADLSASLAYRKPVSTRCEECGEPSQRFQDGRIGRWCEDCRVALMGGKV